MRIKPSTSTAAPAVAVRSPTSVSVTNSTTRKTFLYDQILGDHVDQDGVWNHLKSSIDSLITGYNVSIMAYGQSGTGKSYTMGTSDSAPDGIIPRAARALFDELKSSNATQVVSSIPTPEATKPRHRLSTLLPKRFSAAPSSKAKRLSLKAPVEQTKTSPWVVSASYVEIYNEQLRDLLISPTPISPPLAISEDKGSIKVTGLKEVAVESADQLLGLLKLGSLFRQTNSTAINAQSSRSHAIFTIQLTQKKVKPETGIISTVTSKINFVDLAGSERLKNTNAEGGRAKEGISINSGLASLGKVISQLSSSSASHISYRDSKLTRILQDSLGGRAITFLIACVTPDPAYVSETLNTLAYAQRARAIQQSPEIQQVESKDDLMSTIQKLQEELREYKIREATRAPRLVHDVRNEYNLEVPENVQNHRMTVLGEEESKNSELDFTTGAIIGDWTIESSKERADRSHEFHKAVEGMISDYELTISSLQTSLLDSRARYRELLDTIAAQKGELEERKLELDMKTFELRDCQENYTKLMKMNANTEMKLKETQKDMKMQRNLLEEQLRYTLEMSALSATADSEEHNLSGFDKLSPAISSSSLIESSPSPENITLTPCQQTISPSSTSISETFQKEHASFVDTKSHDLDEELRAAKGEIKILKLNHDAHANELQELTAEYNRARKEIHSLKDKNEKLENELAKFAVPI